MGEAANPGQLNIWLSFLRDLLPLIGVAVGAGLQYLFSRSGETKRHERTLRLEAYAAYLKSVGEMETLKAVPEPIVRSEIFARAIAAKARVCVHGSATVVEALAKFEGLGGEGMTPEKKEYFLRFVEAIRSETGAKGALLDQKALNAILFGEKQAPQKAK